MTVATTKLFMNNTTQAVRLPKDAAFPDDVTEVEIIVSGNARVIVPKGGRWDYYFSHRIEVSDDFLDYVVVLPFDAAAAREAGSIRADPACRGTPIGPYDLLIGAQALASRLALASGNSRDFRRVRGLHVENWR